MDLSEALDRLEPNLVDQFLGALAADPITVEPVTDYIADPDERCHLFRDLVRIHREHGSSSRLNAAMLAFVMVAPIPEIRSCILVIRGVPSPPMMQSGLNAYAPLAMKSCTFPHPQPPFQPRPLTLNCLRPPEGRPSGRATRNISDGNPDVELGSKLRR